MHFHRLSSGQEGGAAAPVASDHRDVAYRRGAAGRIAIFQDSLVQMGGAERVLQALLAMLPGATLHTTIAAPWRLDPDLASYDIQTTWMRRLPAPDRLYRHYVLLYPFAIETADLRHYDLILTSCCGYAKGIRKRSDAIHVCYCHTPMRWVWRYDDYVSRERLGAAQRRVLPWLMKPLRRWDVAAAARPDHFIANSTAVAERIRQIYGRDATVIPPPIRCARFHASAQHDDYYLVLCRLVPYKRVDLAIEACNRLKRRLLIVGDGPDRERLQRIAGPTIRFAGRLSDEEVNMAAAHCRALLFPGEEDFGLVPLEVNASGRPVVAWRGGGALDTVREGTTGVFFDEPTPESLADAILELERGTWDAAVLQAHAARFDETVFAQRILGFLKEVGADVCPAMRAH